MTQKQQFWYIVLIASLVGLYWCCGCGQSASANVKTDGGDSTIEQDPKDKSVDTNTARDIMQKNVTNSTLPYLIIILCFVFENILVIGYILWSKRFPEIGRR